MIALWTLALAGPCELPSPADQAFDVAAPPDADGVHVTLLLAPGDDADWLDAMLAPLEARELTVGILLKARDPSAALEARVKSAVDAGHQVVAWLSKEQVPTSVAKGPTELRKLLKPLSARFGRVRSAVAPLSRKSEEAIMHRVGVKALLESNGPASSAPRSQLRFEGQPDNGVIFPAGPYSGSCGGESRVRGFTPPAADRITQAVYGARSDSIGIVRTVILPGSDTDSTVLDRWLETVASPIGLRVGTPQRARADALRLARGDVEKTWTPTGTDGGRLVRLGQVTEAAESLLEVDAIPRMVAGDMNPTEAFQAFARVLAGKAEGDVVRLAALEGPAELGKSGLSGPTPIDRDALIGLCAALISDKPSAIPAALPVDGRLLTAPELLTAMAAAIAGKPAVARQVAVPEPNALGLGWGRATTP